MYFNENFSLDTEVYNVLDKIIYLDRFPEPINAKQLGAETRYCRNGIELILNKLEKMKIINLKFVETKNRFNSYLQVTLNPKQLVLFSNKIFIDCLRNTAKENKKLVKTELESNLKQINKFLLTKTYAQFFLGEISDKPMRNLDDTVRIPMYFLSNLVADSLSKFENKPVKINKKDYLLFKIANEKYSEIIGGNSRLFNMLEEFFYYRDKRHENLIASKWLKEWGE
jgi:hypothetical protein